MGRPARYTLKDGTIVPSVTTIIGRFKESGALIHWAAGQAADHVLKGVQAEINAGSSAVSPELVASLCASAKSAYRETRDAAAAAGTLAHGLIEADILGHPVTIEGSPELVAKARSAYEAYRSWADGQRLKFLWTEMPLISEKYRFGGTPDALAIAGNNIVLCDWKTSNSVYGDYLIQLAAYKQLVEENQPGVEITGFYLCRFAKENADFAVHHYPELKEAWRMFELLREAYELDKALKKRAA